MVSKLERHVSDDLVIAEAAAWLARLQGPSRTAATEAAFREWLTAHPAHEHAFGRATDMWDILPGAAREARVKVPPRRYPPRLLTAGCAALVVVVASVLLVINRYPSYATGVGDQQTISLSDGTRVTLNTDTQLRVEYAVDVRRVQLVRGEALFEVAKNPHRPFVVEAGGEEVKALGTTFVVRDSLKKVAVTLLEGRVEIARPQSKDAGKMRTVLTPGERITVPTRSPEKAALDRPKIEAVTAWRRGEVMFDDVSIAAAAGELARYSRDRIVTDDPAVANLRVSGVFATRDPGEFAEAMAQLYHLKTVRQGDEIALTRD